MLDSLIIGAGISGLSTAFTLKQNNKNILISERQPRVGGNIISNAADGFLWEEGPNSFQPNAEMLKLAVEVGLKDQLVLADRRLPRYVYWNQRLNAVPMSPPSAITTGLLSPVGKLRAFLGALGFVPANLREEETIFQFVRRHLGPEVAERLISPFVSGVYAGDVHQLSMAAAFRRVFRLQEAGGGLVPGAILSRKQQPPKPEPDANLPKVKRGELGSFQEGLQQLPTAIAHHLKDQLRLNWAVTHLERTPQNTYIAHFDTPDGAQQIETRSLVLTTPAYITADLLNPLSPPASQALSQIDYPPVACVVIAYPDNAFTRPLKGFGNLNPRNQGIRTLGTIWSSTLFPGRNPQGWQMLTNFIGGATDREIAKLSPEAIVQAVHQDLQGVLLAKDIQPKVLAVRLWERAIPQYTLGHLDRLETIANALETLPGVFLCANYTDGVALGDCVRRGRETAETIDSYCSQHDN
ncbi:MAG: protoporphyrinogen oxidase [Kamptonema sp. SIO4C4]|nr:protoporphyrinogen oxidase [Kamptonema sp. SIO4C4]